MKFINHQPIRYSKLRQIRTRLGTYSFSLLISTILLTTIVLIARSLGGLQVLELLVYDWMINLNHQNEPDSRLLVVEITDKDIEQQNSWPIADRTIAKVLENLQQHQPKVIGFDLFREVPVPPGTKTLREQLRQDNVVVIQLIGNGANSVAAPPGVAPEQIGFNDFVIDVEDDVLRRNLMYVQFGETETQQMYSFALRISLKYLGEDKTTFQVSDRGIQIGDRFFPDLQTNSGGYQLLASETAGKQILINYRSPQIAPTVSLGDVLAGKVDPALIKDKIVLIGTSAPSIQDIVPTPYRGSFMPGVMAHGQMVSQILSVVEDDAPLIWFWSEWVEGLWIWGWSLLGAAIAWKLKHPLSIMLVTIASLGGLWFVCWLLFMAAGWIPFVPAGIALAITAAGVVGYKALYNLSFDSLTGLPNRTLFAKQLKELKLRHRSNQGYIAVLCIDLDRFKLINDALGYQTGDRILIDTAQRLQSYLDAKAIIARVGADEFAIAFKTTEDSTEAIEVVHQLDRELAVPFQLQQQNIFTSASIGLALNPIGEELQSEELLQASHTAMYKAKISGKNQYQIFATKMQEQALARLQLEADLNQAISNQEFELYYQPIVSFSTGKLAGFEALVRWISPTRGFISPGAFIPVAEETGLIVPMGKWILSTACHQMQQWRKQFSQAQDVTMSVNLSSRQFSQPDLIAQIQEALIISELDPARLKLEITESMVMDDVENTIVLLNQLKELGIKISLDDFGTGFSSFSYLDRFPTDTLKIDRSFVSNMSQGTKNIEIVSTIVILAHKLGMDVIAEGIETEAEKAILRGFDCEYGQGYYFAKPLPQHEVTELFANNTQW